MRALDAIERELFEICGAPEYGVDTEETSGRIIAALSAAGYVIVPREPTAAMIDAGNECEFPVVAEIYSAMLTAAQGQPK